MRWGECLYQEHPICHDKGLPPLTEAPFYFVIYILRSISAFHCSGSHMQM